MLAATILNEYGPSKEPWFSDAAIKLSEQIHWKNDGEFTTDDDGFLEGLGEDYGRAIQNIEDSSKMRMDLDSEHSTTFARRRADDQSMNSFGALAQVSNDDHLECSDATASKKAASLKKTGDDIV